MKNKTIAIDIDGTICSEERTFERSLATPMPGAAETISILRKQGCVIILWTGRGWEQYKVTKKWLIDNNIEFDQILMGKPIVDHFIDDRAIPFTTWANLRLT